MLELFQAHVSWLFSALFFLFVLHVRAGEPVVARATVAANR